MNFKQLYPLTLIDEEILNRVRLAHICDSEVLLVTYDDEVLAYGKNNSGCLGLEDTDSRTEPDFVGTMDQKRVKSSNPGFSLSFEHIDKSRSDYVSMRLGFAFGGGIESGTFVLTLTFTGTVYFCGSDFYGDPNEISTPVLMSQLTTKVMHVACGTLHCLALNIDGEVFSWGGNEKGQLGIGSSDNTGVPIKIEELAEKLVVKISCGSHFSVAVLDSGEVFTWGSNGKGQLGLNDETKKCCIPKIVSNLKDSIIKKIICGRNHVLALNDVCELYVWGENSQGQLGLGDFKKRLIPTKNVMLGRVTQIAANHRSETSAALTENYKVFLWGACKGWNIAVPKETPYDSLHEAFVNFTSPCITYKSVTCQFGHQSINETLRNAFEDKESSDLTIVAEGKEIFVHRTVLRLRSDYFRAMLQEHWADETQKCINIDQSYNAIHAYLKYLYCGELKAEPKLALELLAVADEYDDRPLKRLCEKAILRGITVDNMAALYSIASKLDGKKLRQGCLSFAANHLSDLVHTSGFDEWDVKTMREFFRQCGNRKLFRS